MQLISELIAELVLPSLQTFFAGNRGEVSLNKAHQENFETMDNAGGSFAEWYVLLEVLKLV